MDLGHFSNFRYNDFQPLKAFTYGQEDSFSDYLKQLPFDKRIDLLTKKNFYLSMIECINKEILKAVKEERKSKGMKNPMPKEEEKEIYECNVRFFFRNFFTKEEISNVWTKLCSETHRLSKADHQFLFMYTKLIQNTDFFEDFSYESLLPFLTKGLSECSDLVGQTLSESPKKVFEYGIHCLDKEKDDAIKERVDTWVSRWLNKKTISSLYHDDNFQNILLEYLEKKPIQAHCVVNSLLFGIQKMPESLQTKIWECLFSKVEKNPQGINSLRDSICYFWQQSSSDQTRMTFYQNFSKLPQGIRSQILGKLPSKVLKQYWNTIYPKTKEILSDTIQIENGQNFLGWHLFQQGDIKSDQMIQILGQLDLKKNEAFFLNPKKILDGDVFIKVANDLARSPYYFWKWIRSFKDTYDFKNNLAVLYPTLSDKVHQTKPYSIALNKNFDLIYHLACAGDTGSLIQLKNSLGADLFWKCLTEEKERKTSGFSALCHLGKRGIFKLISDLSPEKQRALFLEKNSQGKSALDECYGNFLRMVQENIFNQTYQKEKAQPEESAKKIITEEKGTSLTEIRSKALFPRKIFCLPAFEKEMEEYKITNPDLYQEVQEAMEDLATMSKERMHMELKEGLKNRMKLSKNPCVVKDIRGNNYRLGYRVCGDADKNQGKIVFLFFWTHQEYDNKLWDKTEYLVKQALSLMNTPPDLPPIPTNPGNTGR